AKAKRSQVVALCDLLEDRMEQVASELPEPVKRYTDYKEMCRDPEIDAVFVGTPNQFHVPVAREVVRNGKHVMVTKPLSDSVEAARTLVEEAEAAGVVNMMSLSTRFDPRTQYLGRAIQDGQFGDLYYGRARSVRRSGIPSWSMGFVQRGGGAFRDMGVHVLDAAWWLLGMPKPVSVTGVSGAKFGPRGVGYWDYKPQPELGPKYEADDYATGFIRFENGVSLQVESFWASHQPEDLQIELFGTEAGAKLVPPTIYRTMDNAPVDCAVTLPKGPEVWELLADHFNSCVLDGTPCAAPLRHGLIVQEMMEALLTSADEGREVTLGAAK
ncbi:MAG TPA: Gfo/Idh/MocA family oxidoreductase, partial [Roseiflexaceae bacterium]|nr:Gfo/Idh/MocA family oxidoreductase [Roseiflexaceae bacterium]